MRRVLSKEGGSPDSKKKKCLKKDRKANQESSPMKWISVPAEQAPTARLSGFDVDKRELNSACYDLWHRSREPPFFPHCTGAHSQGKAGFCWPRHTRMAGDPSCSHGHSVRYISMPSLWMRSYSNTLLERMCTACVRSQQAYATRKNVSLGISESAYFQTRRTPKLPVTRPSDCLITLPAQVRDKVARHLAVFDIFCPLTQRRCPW